MKNEYFFVSLYPKSCMRHICTLPMIPACSKNMLVICEVQPSKGR